MSVIVTMLMAALLVLSAFVIWQNIHSDRRGDKAQLQRIQLCYRVCVMEAEMGIKSPDNSKCPELIRRVEELKP